MDEQEMLAEIERLKRLSSRRTIKQVFKDAVGKFETIINKSKYRRTCAEEMTLISLTVLGFSAVILLIVIFLVLILITKGLFILLIPTLAAIIAAYNLFKKD